MRVLIYNSILKIVSFRDSSRNDITAQLCQKISTLIGIEKKNCQIFSQSYSVILSYFLLQYFFTWPRRWYSSVPVVKEYRTRSYSINLDYVRDHCTRFFILLKCWGDCYIRVHQVSSTIPVQNPNSLVSFLVSCNDGHILFCLAHN